MACVTREINSPGHLSTRAARSVSPPPPLGGRSPRAADLSPDLQGVFEFVAQELLLKTPSETSKIKLQQSSIVNQIAERVTSDGQTYGSAMKYRDAFHQWSVDHPQPVHRKTLHPEPGDKVSFAVEGEKLTLQRDPPRRARLEQGKFGRPVLVAPPGAPPMTAERVKAILEELP